MPRAKKAESKSESKSKSKGKSEGEIEEKVEEAVAKDPSYNVEIYDGQGQDSISENIEVKSEADKVKNVPPVKQLRNFFGLLETAEYKFRKDGKVDYKAMIDPECIIPNKDNTDETDIAKLKDKDLIVLLLGYRRLAALRGYSSIDYDIVSASQDFVCVKCTINWIPNYETDYRAVRFSSTVDKHLYNVQEFGKNHLTAFAENAAFCRAVRNFLEVPIVSKDEIGPKGVTRPTQSAGGQSADQPASKKLQKPQDILQSIVENDKGLSFEKFKEKIAGNKDWSTSYPSAPKWSGFSDIPASTALDIIGKLNKSKKAKKTEAMATSR